MARWTKGKASPSFSPASAVSVKRTSSSSPVPGGPTCTSPASTGSVGASAAPSSSAAASDRPRPQCPMAAMARMQSGMASASSRQVAAQARRPTRRSSFSPAPVSATMTTNSVSRSASFG